MAREDVAVRIRQVKPSFWSDVRMADLPAPVRLFYIGLWMQADDAGWLRWDVPQIAAELYGFESRGRRERNVAAFGDALEAAGRIARLDCGHAVIETMVGHQRLSSHTKQVLTVAREHDECVSPAHPRGSPQVPAETRTSPPGKELVRTEERVNGNGKGTERLGTGSAGARAASAAAPTLMTVEELQAIRDAEDEADRQRFIATRARH